VPWGVRALTGTITDPAWKRKPSWYLVTTDDMMIPPPAQRDMARRAGSKLTEAKGSHAIYISKPESVASVIKQAAAPSQ
jgi:pimeloyl-ACP methyl ester carboxylesterase